LRTSLSFIRHPFPRLPEGGRNSSPLKPDT
jgi:hypothetical protein